MEIIRLALCSDDTDRPSFHFWIQEPDEWLKDHENTFDIEYKHVPLDLWNSYKEQGEKCADERSKLQTLENKIYNLGKRN